MTTALLIAFTFMLAAANGANDNIKGAATLLGSGVLGYRGAIALATIATAIGGIVSIFLANGLLQAFSGKSIVPDALTVAHAFLLSVAIGAAATVWIATFTGMPISTTHALLGGLVGAGLAASPDGVVWGKAAKAMLLPLLLSPLIAMTLAYLAAPLLKRLRQRAAVSEPCVCVESTAQPATEGGGAAMMSAVVVGHTTDAECATIPGRSVHRLPMRLWLDRAHLLSAAAVSFARGLNDTPKIAALLVAGGSLSVMSSSIGVLVAMALGGLLAARRVANTLAFNVTRIDAGDGFGGNLVTALLVIGASRIGLPVSTTHVSTGAIFGIAAANATGQLSVIRHILLSWCFTLPLAGVIAYLAASLIH